MRKFVSCNTFKQLHCIVTNYICILEINIFHNEGTPENNCSIINLHCYSSLQFLWILESLSYYSIMYMFSWQWWMSRPSLVVPVSSFLLFKTHTFHRIIQILIGRDPRGQVVQPPPWSRTTFESWKSPRIQIPPPLSNIPLHVNYSLFSYSSPIPQAHSCH